MAEPIKRAERIEQISKDLIGVDRREAIWKDKCQPAPIGCGGFAEHFRNEVSRREYKISGLCQECQDKFFGED